jgi:hypothetical protein
LTDAGTPTLPPPERLGELVVTGLESHAGGDRTAIQRLHRLRLERPDPVAADHAHDGYAAARERVELHRREAKHADTAASRLQKKRRARPEDRSEA